MKENNQILECARYAALEAGKYLLAAHRAQIYGLPDHAEGEEKQRVDVEYKGPIDLVTAYDRGSQDIICKIINAQFPSHSILAEEDLELQRNQEQLWVIDPIDGTTNFAHALPMFCVSIAFLEAGLPHIGVVYLPALDELFYAVRGQGAFLNDQRICVSRENQLTASLLATGFPYNRRENIDFYLAPFKQFKMEARGVRRMGSAAIDLVYTASGRFDGYWEYNLHPWDTAAASLILLEAGGTITNFSGQPFNPFMKECLASNGLIHQRMLEIIQKSK